MNTRVLAFLILNLLVFFTFDHFFWSKNTPSQNANNANNTNDAIVYDAQLPHIAGGNYASKYNKKIEIDNLCLEKSIAGLVVHVDCKGAKLFTTTDSNKNNNLLTFTFKDLPEDINWQVANNNANSFSLHTKHNDIIYKIQYNALDKYLFKVSFESYIHSKAYDSDVRVQLIKLNAEGINDTIISHQGFVFSDNGITKEVDYKKIKDKDYSFNNVSYGWTSISDQYWLESMIFNSAYANNLRFNVENIGKYYIADALGMKSGDSMLLFSGVKDLSILNDYAASYNIKNFKKNIDLGWFSIIVVPIYYILQFLIGIFGNAGIAIIALTICIRVVCFPVNKKMYKMRALTPKITEIKKRYSGDNKRISKEIMKFYAANNISPISGCLPLLIQMPLFFSLYKTLYISSDIHMQPFLFLHDLSLPDYTRFLNLFGILPIEAPDLWVLNVGIMPILLAFSMFYVMRMSMSSADNPHMQTVSLILPVVILFATKDFPSGLLLYWLVNNILSIIENIFFNRFSNATRRTT